jgi:hypothetical protein
MKNMKWKPTTQGLSSITANVGHSMEESLTQAGRQGRYIGKLMIHRIQAFIPTCHL